MNPNPLEKEIEAKVAKWATAHGVLNYKFTAVGRRSVPDRIFFPPGGRAPFLIEFKRKGEKPTEKQWIEIGKIQAQGTQVFVVDDVPTGIHLVTLYGVM